MTVFRVNLKTQSSATEEVNFLATQAQQNGDFLKARDLFSAVLIHLQKAYPEGSLETAILHNNLGSVLQDLREYRKALYHYNQAFDIANEVGHFSDEDLANLYNNIGSCYKTTANMALAITWTQEAVPLFEKAFGLNHEKTLLVKSNLKWLKDHRTLN